MAKKAHFHQGLFDFLEQLAANNDKGWFAANKERFEGEVREPMLAFISDFGSQLAKISPHFIADPRKQGGSMFRIHRDVRFSKDKSPYKTHTAAQFRHEAGKDVHAPGFYLHLEPGNVFAGAGIWHPDPVALRAIRERIAEDPAGWKKVKKKVEKAGLSFHGDSLKRAPKDFDAEHPLIEDIKRKDFVVMVELDADQALSEGFVDTFAKTCRGAAPLVALICQAIDQPF